MTDYRESWDITTEEGSLCFASAIYSRLVGGEQDESELLWLAEYLRVNSTTLAQPEPEIEPAAYIHRQGNYTEVSEMSLSGDEKARGWTEEPLFRHHPGPARAGGGKAPPRVGHILRLAEIIREVDGNHDTGAAALAEAILSHPGSRWSSTIEPVPVAERLPGPEDCDAEGRCW